MFSSGMNVTMGLDHKKLYVSYASLVKGYVKTAYKKAILKAKEIRNQNKNKSTLGLPLVMTSSLI